MAKCAGCKDSRRCFKCKGDGRVGKWVTKPCPVCRGNGVCPTCKGRG